MVGQVFGTRFFAGVIYCRVFSGGLVIILNDNCGRRVFCILHRQLIVDCTESVAEIFLKTV